MGINKIHNKISIATRQMMLVIGGLIICVSSSISFAKEKTKPVTKDLLGTKSSLILGKIDGESTDKMSIVTIRLSEKPSWKKIKLQDHGTFLQILLPNTLVPEPGTFYEGNSPYLKKIAAFQTTSTEGAVRIFLSEDASLVKKTTSAEILDSRIVITTDHAALKKQLASILPVATSKISNTKPPSVPASNVVNAKATAPSLKERLIEVSIFLGLMIFFLIAVLSIKPLMKKRQMKIQGESYVSMNILSNLTLAPKQKLTLIQVGNEQILVSVSPDNVNFISKVGEKPIGQHTVQNNTLRAPLHGAPSLTEKKQATLEQTKPRASTIEKFNRSMKPLRAPSRKAGTAKSSKDSSTSFSSILSEEKSTNPKIKKSSSINVQISDEGITQKKKEIVADASSSSIDDVTKLIREKLRSLPSA